MSCIVTGLYINLTVDSSSRVLTITPYIAKDTLRSSLSRALDMP
jgi:hypothetical protein